MRGELRNRWHRNKATEPRKGNTFTQTEEMKEYWKIITTSSVITYFCSLSCRVEALADVTLAAWSKENAGFR